MGNDSPQSYGWLSTLGWPFRGTSDLHPQGSDESVSLQPLIVSANARSSDRNHARSPSCSLLRLTEYQDWARNSWDMRRNHTHHTRAPPRCGHCVQTESSSLPRDRPRLPRAIASLRRVRATGQADAGAGHSASTASEHAVGFFVSGAVGGGWHRGQRARHLSIASGGVCAW